MRSRITPLGAAATGALAGAVGTLAMDLLWYRRQRQKGTQASFSEWEFSTGTEGYDQVGAPGKMGKRVVEAISGESPPAETAGFAHDAVHWLTGMMWGVAHGMVAGSARVPAALLGPVTGAVAWATAYTVLAPTGLYKPMWQYEAQTLWKDLSAHLLYGAMTGATFRALNRS